MLNKIGFTAHKNIAVNIITGFLGAGKTTTILSLLKNKPDNARWAVLVNEFGEVGIDAGLIAGQSTNISLREVPGGCLCCAAGVPMRVALNQLIQQANPHRIFIEPTGLGHPQELLAQLRRPEYHAVFNVEATITVVDARKINDARYTDNRIFNQQLQIADVIVANKMSDYDEKNLSQLKHYLVGQGQVFMPEIIAVDNGELPPHYLMTAARFNNNIPHNRLAPIGTTTLADDVVAPERTMPASGILKLTNVGEGFVSVGWIFDARFVFNRTEVAGLCRVILAERLKAIFITDEGCFSYNKVDGQLVESVITSAIDSRIELIAQNYFGIDGLEPVFLSCTKSIEI
ncbi:MAG: GTP-binding protein [Marinagarivorans sp.]|nr:GTP-binding protein [Marinagarivorans sp.]